MVPSLSSSPSIGGHRDQLMLEELLDLDSDGIPEIAGKACISQAWGNGLLTYDPFNVYKLNAIPGGPAKLSLALSKSYHLKHYYGWAAPNCSEDFAVVLHPRSGAKPAVAPKERAERSRRPSNSRGGVGFADMSKTWRSRRPRAERFCYNFRSR
jgi:hypothetical protein